MGGMAVICKGGAVCEFYGYPSICKDCKRNAMAAKNAKTDFFRKKEVFIIEQNKRD